MNHRAQLGFFYGFALVMSVVLGGGQPSVALAEPADQRAADPALDLYYAANASYNRKLYPIAATQYQDFLKRFGNHEKSAQARYGLALSYFALKQFGKAEPELQRLLEAKDLDDAIDRGRLVLMHAQCLINAGNTDAALDRLTEALKTLPKGAQRAGAIAAVIDLHYGKSEWEQTLEWVAKLAAAEPSAAQSVRAGYQQGMAYYRLSRSDDAVKTLQAVRAKAEKAGSKGWVTRVDQLLSASYLALKDFDKAEASLASALAGLSGAAAVDARYQLAGIKFQRGQFAEARGDYSAFLEAMKAGKFENDPRVREARFRVARCLFALGQGKQADGIFRDLMQKDDEVAARSVLWRSRIITRDTGRRNRYESAVDVLSWAKGRPWYKNGFKSREGQPANTIVADIDYDLANALMLQASPNWDAARGLFRRIEQRRGDYRHMSEVLSQRAICEHKLGKFEDSLRTTDAFLKRDGKKELVGDVRFLRAENLYMLRRGDEAIKAYADFLDADKGHRDRLAAQYRIAQVHHQAGRSEESNRLAVPLLKQAPQGELFARLSYLVGDNYFRQSKWEEATEPLEAFLKGFIQKPSGLQKGGKVQRATNVDDALVQLGVAYSQQRNRKEAIAYFDLLVRMYSDASPHLPLALAELGKLFYEIGEYDRAQKTLDAFVSRYKDSGNKRFQTDAAKAEVGRVYYYLGWVASSQKRYADAASHFGFASKTASGRKGVQGVPLSADAALQRGIALVNDEKYADAAKHLRDVAGRYKDHPKIGLVTYYTGLAYARVKDWRQASGYFKQVVDRWPEADFADKALYEWAWSERTQKRNDQAIKLYTKLLTDYKQSPLALKVQSELAELNLDAGAQDAVIAKLKEALNNAGDDKLKFELQYQLANAYFTKQDHEQAAPLFEALIPKAGNNPLLPSILFQAGEARLALTEAAPAREHFMAASKVRGTPAQLSESIRLRLGETQNMTGQHKEAASTYQGFLRSYQQSQWKRNAQYGYAFALEKQQRYKEAIREYQRLLPQQDKNQKLDKWMVQARFQIGGCYFNEQQYDKAIAEFVNVDANSRGFPGWRAKAVLELGRVALAQDKDEEAQQRMKEVITRFPNTTAATVAQQYLDQLRSGR